MSWKKICDALSCKKAQEIYIPHALPPVHGDIKITIAHANKAHHKYTSTEVDIHEALRTPEFGGRISE